MQRWRNGIRADLRTSDRKVVWVAPVVGVRLRSQQVDCKSRGIKNPQRIICRGGETAYALVSGTSDRKVVWVQIPSSAPKTCCWLGFCALHNNVLHWNPHCVAGARQ